MPQSREVRRELLAERGFPVPDGAEMMNRIPRRSIEDRVEPDAGAVELVVVAEFIRRSGPVRECVPVRPSSVPHDRRFPHYWLSSRSY